MFPYPISKAQMFPSDTNIKPHRVITTKPIQILQVFLPHKRLPKSLNRDLKQIFRAPFHSLQGTRLDTTQHCVNFLGLFSIRSLSHLCR